MEWITLKKLNSAFHSVETKSVPKFLLNIWQIEVPDWFINQHKER